MSHSDTQKRMPEREVLLGNVVIAWGLVKYGCQIMTSYPGTPSSEILGAVAAYAKYLDLPLYTEWSINEKVALETAIAASYTGKRTACAMKQVGLNVAADPLMSAVYTGVVGGLVIIVADDPGPHSSQTEQDTRMFGKFAKAPVFDPSSPLEALDMIKAAFELSEQYRIPVILRPSLRVCHAKQAIEYGALEREDRAASFQRNPARWAATPRDRLKLHGELNAKLKKLAEESNRFNILTPGDAAKGIIAAGVEYAAVVDFLQEHSLASSIPVLKIGMPTPLPSSVVDSFIAGREEVLILEDPDATIEEQATLRSRLRGRLDGYVPAEGELTAEVIDDLLSKFLHLESKPQPATLKDAVAALKLPTRRPTLCAGCPHRASFWSIKRTFPKGIFPSDIGCYTLGKNLQAVDTCLVMGGAISLANGLYRSFKQDKVEQPIIATIGDSTFFHSGITGLANAVYTDCRYVLVILDNSIVAMTGMQPPPTSGILADGSSGNKLSLEDTVRGLGVKFLEVIDAYDTAGLRKLLKQAYAYTKQADGGMAVLISRHPCLINDPSAVPDFGNRIMKVTDACNRCGYCLEFFECPALSLAPNDSRVQIDETLCVNCGVCVAVCAQHALQLKEVKP